jgi:hypothetical protein
MAIGLDTAIMGSFTVLFLLIVLCIFLFVGTMLWASRAPKVKGYGLATMVASLVVLFITIVAMLATPAAVIVPADEVPGTFSVLSVTEVTDASYASASKTFTVAMTVNTTSGEISPDSFSAVFNVQRLDAGATTDIKTVTASVTQSRLTDPVSGDTFNVILPDSYGAPDCDWLMTPGNVSATNTLSSQLGLTPYETGSFNVTITWNEAAFTTSNIAENDVIYVGSINIGGTVYSIQVLIDTVNT